MLTDEKLLQIAGGAPRIPHKDLKSDDNETRYQAVKQATELLRTPWEIGMEHSYALIGASLLWHMFIPFNRSSQLP